MAAATSAAAALSLHGKCSDNLPIAFNERQESSSILVIPSWLKTNYLFVAPHLWLLRVRG